MDGIKTQVKQTGKQAAIKIAKQMAREPLEILKEAPKQALSSPDKRASDEEKSGESKELSDNREQEKAKDKEKSKRHTLALEAELKDIRRQKVLEDLQRRIAGGEEINLESYPELTIEQKQVLKAQLAAVKARKEKEKNGEAQTLIEPTTKPKKNLLAGVKTRVERLKHRGEIRMPPSG
ncbi:hypothetical protein HYT59_00035 [Candidatus Woesebacteria bacterium]|nr:hypothetical protein [Candidatus Woesebacteria bacterium]